MSLKYFHYFFMLVVIVGADMFGAWAVYNYPQTGDRVMLALGIVSFLGGFGLIVYLYRLVRKMDEAHIA